MDRLEKQLSDVFDFIRVETSSNLGKYVKESYTSTIVPTFIVLDREAKEKLRTIGRVPRLETLVSLRL
ncbi:MAG: hypothetical protein DK304_000398 [Chloroflexi bacterium]|nr:MAG: hypothetical protein DK304_000398 [Chloroflexota bacterium]